MRPDAPFSVQVAHQNGVAWLALRGELDMSVTDLLADPLASVEEDGASAILLDLRDLTFIDSSGLNVILAAWSRTEANGQQLRVVGVSKTCRRVFEVTGAAFLIDTTEAVSTLGQFTNGHRSRLQDASGGERHG